MIGIQSDGRHMNKRISVVAFALWGLLASCTVNPHPMDMTEAIQNARTRSDHEALARHYEDAAKEMQLKADEHRKLLAQYEAKNALYDGRHNQNLVSHCQRLVNIYEQAAAENLSMADSHHRMAAEVK